jgi:ureidoacrylate peracid hydrolase
MISNASFPQQHDLAPLLEPARCALLVIDVQNDYCHPEGALGRGGADLGTVAAVMTNIERLIEAARSLDVTVVFLRNWHESFTDSAAWVTRVPKRSGAGQARSWGAEFYRVAPVESEPVINKHRYSGFIGTPLDSTLHMYKRDRLILTGFGTNVCVESTARHAVFLDYRIVFASDATGTPDGDAAHTGTLQNIAKHFGRVAATSEILSVWHRYRRRNTTEGRAGRRA